MYRFANIEYLYLLAIIPVLWLFFIAMLQWRKKALDKFGQHDLVQTLIPGYAKNRMRSKAILYSFVLILVILGLANPQIGSKMQEVKREGVDIMIALDLSNSMNAEDLSPSRIERSKMAIQQFIDKLHSDRIGIVIFGGQAYTQLPITTDYAAAKLFLSTINTSIIPTQGTAIGAAIDLSMEAFNFESPSSKSIIVITDGENHEDDAIDAAKNAASKNVTVHTVGVGSPQGSPIPIYRGNQQTGFRQDGEGNTVVTKLNEEMLQEISTAGNGIYVHATNNNSGLKYISDEVENMEKTELGSKIYTDYEDRFQFPIGLALLLLLLEIFISDKKSNRINSEKLFKVRK
jgi:Ca-activated chloride channel family protein